MPEMNRPNWSKYRSVDISEFYQPQVAPASLDEPDDVEWADYAKSVMAGGASLVQATGWLANVLGAEDIGSSIEELGSDAVDYWNESLSDPAKAEIAKQVIRKNEEGEYEWGDPSFSTIGLMGAQSLLGTAAGMGMGAGLTKVLQVFANPFGRKALETTLKGAAGRLEIAGKSAEQVAKVRNIARFTPSKLLPGEIQAAKKLNLVDTVLGAGGFGLGEGTVGGISAGSSVYDNIMNMDVEKLMANERYRQVYESTDNSISELERHQYAADTVAKEASTAAGWQSGLTTALLGAPMGAYFGRILGGAKLSSTLPRGIATGAAGEAAQEFAQSGVEQYISNLQVGKLDPEVDPFDDVLNAAVSGALAGGLLGGVVGPAAVGGSRAELAAEESRRRDEVKKIGGPLTAAAARTAEAGADRTAVMEIVNDALAQRLDMNDALDNLAALEREQKTGEEPRARKPPPEPVQVQEPEPEPAQVQVQAEPGGEIEEQVPEVPAARQEEAPAEARTPEEVEKAIETAAGGPVAIESVDPTTLKVDAPRFQFKAQTDAEGVSTGWRLSGKARPASALLLMVISVWLWRSGLLRRVRIRPRSAWRLTWCVRPMASHQRQQPRWRR
jgi:outer membrane biosynthesis protein TonB